MLYVLEKRDFLKVEKSLKLLQQLACQNEQLRAAGRLIAAWSRVGSNYYDNKYIKAHTVNTGIY